MIDLFATADGDKPARPGVVAPSRARMYRCLCEQTEALVVEVVIV
jgi:hypothetical protein